MHDCLSLAEISPDASEHFIEDLDSTNGTLIGDSEYRILPLKCYQLLDKKLLTLGSASFIYEIVQKPLESEMTFGTAPENPILEVNDVEMMHVDPSMLEDDWGSTQEPATSHVEPVKDKESIIAENGVPINGVINAVEEGKVESIKVQDITQPINQQAEFLMESSQDSPELKPIESIIFQNKHELAAEPIVDIEEKNSDKNLIPAMEDNNTSSVAPMEEASVKKSPKIPVDVDVPSIKTTVKRARFSEDVKDNGESKKIIGSMISA